MAAQKEQNAAENSTAAAAAKRVRVTQIRSAIGYNARQREVLRGLGLRRMHHSVLLPATPAVRGMLRKIPHLLKVEEA